MSIFKITSQSFKLLLSAALLSLLVTTAVQGNEFIPGTIEARAELTQQLDEGRVGIVTGSPGGTYIQLGTDMSRLMQSLRSSDLRIIVQVGAGSMGNLRDLAFLEHVDLALVQADVLEDIRKNDRAAYEYLGARIGYVARFHPEIIHVLARNGPFNSISELQGKRIAIGAPGSGTQITARVLRDEIGLNATFVDMHQKDALAELTKPDGNIDALMYVAGRGSGLFKDLSPQILNGIENNSVYFVPFPTNPSKNSPYVKANINDCLLYTSPSPRDATLSRMPSSA